MVDRTRNIAPPGRVVEALVPSAYARAARPPKLPGAFAIRLRARRRRRIAISEQGGSRSPSAAALALWRRRAIGRAIRVRRCERRHIARSVGFGLGGQGGKLGAGIRRLTQAPLQRAPAARRVSLRTDCAMAPRMSVPAVQLLTQIDRDLPDRRRGVKFLVRCGNSRTESPAPTRLPWSDFSHGTTTCAEQ
jgi:hypothetical protein